jgi:hypothetical protein
MGPDAVASFRQFGFIVIRNGFSKCVVEDAKQELQKMLLSGDPECESVYFEGAVLKKLSREKHTALSTAATHSTSQSSETKLALGTTKYEMPNLSADVRASLIRKFMGFTHTGHPALLAVAEHESLIAAVELLLSAGDEQRRAGKDAAAGMTKMVSSGSDVSGGRAHLFQDMAMIKPPLGGREKPFHQVRRRFY